MAWRWIQNQYNDIRGHLKWAVVCWLLAGGGLTWLAHWLQVAFHANIAGWLALAAPIFSILAVLYLLLFLTPRPDRARANAASRLSLSPVPKPPFALPLPVDLRGEILEIYFYNPQFFLVMGPIHVLCKVRIVNHGPDEATITHCGLEVNLGNFHRLGEIEDIPASWRIKKKVTSVLGFDFEETPIAPELGTPAENERYSKGIPRIGWVSFAITTFGEDVEFPNAEFKIHLKDSLGGEHCIQRDPQVYTRTGEIVVAAGPKPTTSSGGVVGTG